MSNQSLNKEHNSENIIPDIVTKIKELSATKQTYLKFIMQLFPLSNDPKLASVANHLIRLLQNIININKNHILLQLENGLTSVLVSYIFDINDLIKGQLDLEKYEPMHRNLIAINQQIDYYMMHDDRLGFAELRENLFLI